MPTQLRFELYKLMMSLAQQSGFRKQVVYPLELPTRERIAVEPLAPELPRLLRARNFPVGEHAERRYRRFRRSVPLFRLLSRLAPARTTPIASDLEGFLRQTYPERYRRIWPYPPTLPAELAGSDDMLASLAVKGPFAGYLRQAEPADGAPAVAGLAGALHYVIDMRAFEDHPAKPGLMRPGGLAIFGVEGSRLRTRGIVYQGRFHAAGTASFGRVSRAFLCALNTHLTTLLHNVSIHLACVTPMAVATTNELLPEHPLRRLLHFAFQTALIGNRELGHFQIAGPDGFATRLFSHDYPILVQIINRHLEGFRLADLDPEHDLERRGVSRTPFAYPQRDNVLALWQVTRDFVARYLDLYYPDDRAVASDLALEGWRRELDRLLPAGLADGDGWIGSGPLDRVSLKRIAATFLHTSTVTHDQVNNVVWNYSTLNFLIPTVVLESGEEQDQRLSFDFITTLIVTWKPFNMLLDGISQLALDARARDTMDAYIDEMRAAEGRLVKIEGPDRLDLTYPRNLNYSVTN
jgi:Lipoxygenase